MGHSVRWRACTCTEYRQEWAMSLLLSCYRVIDHRAVLAITPWTRTEIRALLVYSHYKTSGSPSYTNKQTKKLKCGLKHYDLFTPIFSIPIWHQQNQRSFQTTTTTQTNKQHPTTKNKSSQAATTTRKLQTTNAKLGTTTTTSFAPAAPSLSVFSIPRAEINSKNKDGPRPNAAQTAPREQEKTQTYRQARQRALRSHHLPHAAQRTVNRTRMPSSHG